jgi:Protein of unknown function (DUF3822)
LAKLIHDIKENSYTPHISALSRLGLFIGLDSFSYAVCDNQQRVHLYREYHLPEQQEANFNWSEFLQNLFAADPALNLSYRQIKVVLASPKYTIVPTQWYRDEERRIYLLHVSDPDKNSITMAAEYPEQTAYLVFEMPLSVHEWLEKMPLSPQYTHLLGSLHGEVASHFRAPDNVVVSFGLQRIFILYYRGDNLIFSNSFVCHSPKDVLYFVLLTLEQFSLSPDFTPVWMMGKMSQDTDLYRNLRRYIHSLYFVPGLTPLKLGEKLSQVPLHSTFAQLSSLL